MNIYDEMYEGVEWHCSSASKTLGSLLPPLMIALSARTVISIGIANSFTEQVLAAGFRAMKEAGLVQDPLVLACDINEACCAVARDRLTAAGVEHDVICADSAEVFWAAVLERHGRTSAEICIIDGDHSYEAVMSDLTLCACVCSGLMLCHDYWQLEKGNVRAIDEFAEREGWNVLRFLDQRVTHDYPFAILQRRPPNA